MILLLSLQMECVTTKARCTKQVKNGLMVVTTNVCVEMETRETTNVTTGQENRIFDNQLSYIFKYFDGFLVCFLFNNDNKTERKKSLFWSMIAVLHDQYCW